LTPLAAIRTIGQSTHPDDPTVFEGLKARLEKLLADHTPAGDPRARAAQLHAALVEAKVAVGTMRDALAATERAVASERKQLEDAERRGRLAAQIPDPETVQVAEQFAARHRERVAVLERKLAAQQEELGLTERDVEQMTAEFRRLRQGISEGPTPAQSAAWRDVETAGGVRPETDLEGELLQSELRRAEMDKAVEAQLEHLKKKMRGSEE
jgi:phage shock protein A